MPPVEHSPVEQPTAAAARLLFATHKRDGPSWTPKPVPLSEELHGLLVGFLSGKPFSDGQRKRLAELIQEELSNKGLWLYDPCTSEIRPKAFAILVPVVKRKTRIEFRRLVPYCKHCPTCQLTARLATRDLLLPEGVGVAHRRQPPIKPVDPSRIAYSRPLATRVCGGASKSNSETVDAPGSPTRLHRLQRVLYTILHDAELDVLDPTATRAKQRQRIVEAIALYRVAAGQATHADHFVVDQAGTIAALEKRARAAMDHLPKGHAPVLHAIVLADDVHDNDDGTSTILVDTGAGTEKLNVHAKVAALKRKTDIARAPFIVILEATLTLAGDIDICSGYAHPVYSKEHWLPVDSQYERDTVQVVMRWLESLEESLATLVVARKALFTIDVGDDLHLSVDFEVTFRAPAGDIVVIIETMGFFDSKYIETKLRAYPPLLQRGALFLDWRSRFTREACDLVLDVQLRVWAQQWRAAMRASGAREDDGVEMPPWNGMRRLLHRGVTVISRVLRRS